MLTRVGNQILLRTKLHRPSATADQVDRPRLKDRLDSSLDRPLILVAAPAGFGKSTLLSAWLEGLTTGRGGVTPPLPAAWLSLDESDNDLSVFLVYFLAAMQSIFPDALSETTALVSGLNFPPVPVIANSLSNELDGLERDFVLVLDDYHTIREQSIHELLSMLLQHPPKGMRLVITTREDPPLPLGALRARATGSLKFGAMICASRRLRSPHSWSGRWGRPWPRMRWPCWPRKRKVGPLRCAWRH